jgi:DNA polymerase-3 subunit chi
VNLGGTLTSWFSHFDHLVEIVVQEAAVLETTRANWKQLKFDGYPITQHDLRS